jgi:uncharacterized protein YifE (UPF0438 family)
MDTPAQQITPLHRTDYPVPDSARLTAEERGLLARYGYWLEALATGSVAPTTPEQAQFVRVAQEGEEPQSAFEVAWVKCRQSTTSMAPPGRRELAMLFNKLMVARTALTNTKDEYSARRIAILEQVREQLDALDAGFADRLADTEAEATRLEAEARQAVVDHGASFWHEGVHAVYTRSRTTWDGKGLAAYAETHPEVIRYRKVSEPSVSLRYKPAEGTAVEESKS